MRTTSEIIEAVMNNEPCTEEELRLCIVSMQHTMVLAHLDHLKWASDESLPLKVKLKAQHLWESVNTGWNVPLDKRVESHNRPGSPELRRRRKTAQAVWDKVCGEQDGKE